MEWLARDGGELAVLLAVPVVLLIGAIAAAASQRPRDRAVGATLFGGFVTGFLAIGGASALVGYYESGGYQGPVELLLVVPAWGAALGCWFGFGVGRLIGRRADRSLPAERQVTEERQPLGPEEAESPPAPEDA